VSREGGRGNAHALSDAVKRDVSSGRWLELLVGVLSFSFVLMVATAPLAVALITSVALVSLLARARERHAVALVSGTVLLMALLVELALRSLAATSSRTTSSTTDPTRSSRASRSPTAVSPTSPRS
jgi:hypothetical protein